MLWFYSLLHDMGCFFLLWLWSFIHTSFTTVIYILMFNAVFDMLDDLDVFPFFAWQANGLSVFALAGFTVLLLCDHGTLWNRLLICCSNLLICGARLFQRVTILRSLINFSLSFTPFFWENVSILEKNFDKSLIAQDTVILQSAKEIAI